MPQWIPGLWRRRRQPDRDFTASGLIELVPDWIPTMTSPTRPTFDCRTRSTAAVYRDAAAPSAGARPGRYDGIERERSPMHPI